MLITIFNDWAKIEKTPNTNWTFFDLLETPITHNLMGTDFSTPITRFTFLIYDFKYTLNFTDVKCTDV